VRADPLPAGRRFGISDGLSPMRCMSPMLRVVARGTVRPEEIRAMDAMQDSADGARLAIASHYRRWEWDSVGGCVAPWLASISSAVPSGPVRSLWHAGGEAAPAAPATAKACTPTKAPACCPNRRERRHHRAGADDRPRSEGPEQVDELNFNTWYDAVIPPTQPLFKQFEEEFNVKLTVDLNPSNRDTAKYTAWYASGTAPDVVCGDNFIWSKFYNANAILEISDYLKRDKIDLKKDYVLMGSEILARQTVRLPVRC
jgi:hypothetical protein